MSITNIGKFSDVIKSIDNIDKTLSLKDQAKALGEILDTLDDLDEVSDVLRHANISKNVAKDALKATQWADTVADIAEGAGDAAEGVSELKKTLDGLGDGMTTGQKAMEGFKNAGKGLLTVFKKAAPIIRNCFYYLPLKTNFHIIIIVIYTEIGILPSIVF